MSVETNNKESSLHATKLEFARVKSQVKTYRWNGKSCWIALEIADFLGYKRPNDFVKKITSDWADSFEPGVDFIKLAGAELDVFKKQLSPTSSLLREEHEGDSPLSPSELEGDSPSSSRMTVPSLIILMDFGVAIAAGRSRTPNSRALRQWIIREVLPRACQTNTLDQVHNIENAAKEGAISSTVALAIVGLHAVIKQDIRQSIEQLRGEIYAALDQTPQQARPARITAPVMHERMTNKQSAEIFLRDEAPTIIKSEGGKITPSKLYLAYEVWAKAKKYPVASLVSFGTASARHFRRERTSETRMYCLD